MSARINTAVPSPNTAESGTDLLPLTQLSDEELCAEARKGESKAYEVLWVRHSSAGLAFARQFSYVADADDLVGEAYTRILATLRNGRGGPATGFRSYLRTVIRHTAASWGRRAVSRKEDTTDTFEDFHGGASAEDDVFSSANQQMAARALRSLPTRWQEVLWYTEVENIPRAEVAALLNMEPNAVSQLAFRARDGLRTAWVQAHLLDDHVRDECRGTVQQLGAHARRKAPTRTTRQVSAHLNHCDRCTARANQLDHIAASLST